MSDLGSLVEATAERLLADQVRPELLVEVEGGQWPARFWEVVESAGLTRPHLPEEAGGAAGSWLDAFVVLRAAGAHAAPIPLAETLVGDWLLTQAGIDPPAGPLTLLPETAPPEALEGDRLTGAFEKAPWGRWATHAVLAARRGGETLIGLAPVAEAEITTGENLAREPRDRLEWRGARVAAVRPAPLEAETVTLLGALARAAQMCGALETILDLAVGYARERVQFGRPIGRFQVIQHELAQMAGEVAAAGIAAVSAFGEVERAFGPERAVGDFNHVHAIAAAKARVGEAAARGAAIAHQVHGAIGFTYEHRLHFYTRRLWAWRGEFGDETAWADRLGREAIGRGGGGLWPWLTSA